MRKNCLKRMNHVKHIRDLESRTKEKVTRHKYKYRNEASLSKHNERVRILEALSSRQQKDDSLLDKVVAQRHARYEALTKAKKDYRFAVEFNCQNASVGKALANHDRNSTKEELVKNKRDIVSKLKKDNRIQSKLVTDYLKHTVLARQAQTVTMKSDLESILKQKASNRKEELSNLIKSHKEKQSRQLRTPALLAVKEAQSLQEVLSKKVISKGF